MFAAPVLASLAACAVLASGAELQGTWSATSPRGYLVGTWTVEDHQSSGVTGTWTLQDTSGKVLLQGGWSASKSPQAWNGAWRSTFSGGSSEFSGTWTSSISASPQADLIEMFKFALRAVVSGTWRAGPSGTWSIRAAP